VKYKSQTYVTILTETSFAIILCSLTVNTL